MRSEKIIVGIMAGITTGLLLGILLATKKGASTRKRILYKITDLKDKLVDKYEDLLTLIVQRIDTYKESMANVYLHQHKKD
jgi:gas vesicle protein